MTAQLEIHAGGVTTDMVEAVWTEVLGELATPGSPIHQEYDTTRLDLTRPPDLTVEVRHHHTGLAILATLGTPIVWWELESLWRDVVRPRLVRRFRVEPGDVVGSRGLVPDVATWPNPDDPMEVAVAARIALLAASGLHPDEKPSPEQDQLASFIRWATDAELVDGRGFAEFLEAAQRRLENDLRHHRNVKAALPDAAAALQDARPIDVVAELYGKLARLAAEEYTRPDLARLPLERFVVDPGTRPTRVTGAVPASRSKVMLTLDTGFDLFALALLPRVLSHELVCHAGAGHPTDGRPSSAQLFEEQFMDRTAQVLLLQWLEVEEMDDLVPAGHLSPLQVRFHDHLPKAPSAGAAAWSACQIAVGKGLRYRQSRGAGAAEAAAMVEATLRLNTTGNSIGDKDRFVEDAKHGRSDAITKFVRLTRGEISAEEVFQ